MPEHEPSDRRAALRERASATGTIALATTFLVLASVASIGAQPREPAPPAEGDAVIEGAPGPLPAVGYRDHVLDRAFRQLPPGVDTIDATVEVHLAFPARRSTRTAVRVMLRLPFEEISGRRFDGELFYNFALTGRVLRGGQPLEDFRYDFRGSAPAEPRAVLLGFTRYLRDGPASFRMWLEDRFSGRVALIDRTFDVPSAAGLAPAEEAERPLPATLQPEAPAGVLELREPPPYVVTGLVRFTATATGALDAVRFWLDDRLVATRQAEPWSVDIDLGPSGGPRRVRAVGWLDGREVATDQVWVNQVDDRFRVRLDVPSLETRPGESFVVRVVVESPDGRAPERVELYLDDALLTSFAAPPYQHELTVARRGAALLRAVALLEDGRSAEDAVLLDDTSYGESLRVGLVELYPLVLDSSGRPRLGLSREAFAVFDNGQPRKIERFSFTDDLPITVGIVIDRSDSMAPHIEAVIEGAAEFLDDVLRTPDDRVAVLSFADQLVLDSPPTADLGAARRALATLAASGGTALHDAIVQSLHFFEGIPGQDALVLFSDGHDQASRLQLDHIRTTSDRVGVAVYVIALERSLDGHEGRRVLDQIAGDTGGRAFFLDDLEGLPEVFAEILSELRSRYLVAYSVPPDAKPSEPRTVRVEVGVPGAKVRARRGYYP